MKGWAARLPWAGAALFLAIAFVWVGRDPRVPREAFQAYSIHNTGPEGLSLAHRYLGSKGAVAALSRPLERSFLEADAVVLRIRPDSPVPPGLRKPAKGG
jgi:hypothetical protein